MESITQVPQPHILPPYNPLGLHPRRWLVRTYRSLQYRLLGALLRERLHPQTRKVEERDYRHDKGQYLGWQGRHRRED